MLRARCGMPIQLDADELTGATPPAAPTAAALADARRIVCEHMTLAHEPPYSLATAANHRLVQAAAIKPQGMPRAVSLFRP